MENKELHNLIVYQDKYIEILTDFFTSVTGCLPHEFSTLDDFSHTVNKMSDFYKENPKRLEESLCAHATLEKNLKQLYSSEGSEVFSIAKKIDACKLNLGGSSRFLKTQLIATRKSLLYTDTVLIPDPMMPWIEKTRVEEKFNHVIPLQTAFFLLHLSDLKGDGFDIPPFFIFPSFEKTLEDNDKQTQDSILSLTTDFFSYYVDSGIENPENILDFAEKYPEEFYKKVEQGKLFVSPGAEPGEPIKVALENYINNIRQWRSEEWCNELLSNGDISVVLNAICERIQPNYHLLENADELRSHPFLCVDAQAHYYYLIANMKNKAAFSNASFDSSTSAILKSLTSRRLDYLANIDDRQLVELRKTNENVGFRRSLRDLVNSLPNTKVEDLGYVASEVCSHIEYTISKHEKEISSLKDKYQAKHQYTAILTLGTLGVSMLPVLAPFLSTLLPVGAATASGKYISEKIKEKSEINNLSKSMVGVISLAKRNS